MTVHSDPILKRVLAGILLLLVAVASPAHADHADICDRAGRKAALAVGVPQMVLLSLPYGGRAVTPTQRRFWPWSIDRGGQSIWFDTAEQAKSHVYRHFLNGERAFRIGCFQLPYVQYQRDFASIEEMFDPELNARAAASMLHSLRRQHGSWIAALLRLAGEQSASKPTRKRTGISILSDLKERDERATRASGGDRRRATLSAGLSRAQPLLSVQTPATPKASR